MSNDVYRKHEKTSKHLMFVDQNTSGCSCETALGQEP